MEKSSLFYLGYVSKKIGFRGKISIKIENGNPNSYLGIDFIYVEIENQLIPYKVVNTNSKKNTFLELKIDGLDNEEKKEIFIPLVTDFIKKVDKKNRIVFFQLPDGLIDLNNNS